MGVRTQTLAAAPPVTPFSLRGGEITAPKISAPHYSNSSISTTWAKIPAQLWREQGLPKDLTKNTGRSAKGPGPNFHSVSPQSGSRKQNFALCRASWEPLC